MTSSATLELTTTSTSTSTVTKHAGTTTVAVTDTSTATSTSTATVTAAPLQGLSWSGNGGENIGTVHVPVDSTIQWTNDGQLMQISDDEDGPEVNSQGASGTSAISAGTYHHFAVNADGNWTIKIVPG